MKRNSLRISVLVLPLLLLGLVAAQLGRAQSLLFIGGTAAPVVSPVTGATITEWGLNGFDVKSADISFSSDLYKGSRVCVQAADGGGPKANGCYILEYDWTFEEDDPIQIKFGEGIEDGLAAMIPASDLFGVTVTILGPINTEVISNIPIQVVDVRWILLDTDTSQVRQVEILFARYGTNVNQCGDNENWKCNFDVLFALQNSDGEILAQVKKTVELYYDCVLVAPLCITVIWDLEHYLSIPGDPVSAEAITRFVVGVEPGDPWENMRGVPDSVGLGAGMTTDGTKIYLMIGSRNRLYRFDPNTGDWTGRKELARAPNSPDRGGALVYAEDDTDNDGTKEGYLYALRGGSKTDFWRYDIDAGTWSFMAPTPAGVGWGGALTWDGENYIYAFRGGETRDFWRYDIAADLAGDSPWTTLDDAPGLVSAGGALVFVEGEPDTELVNDDGVFAIQGGPVQGGGTVGFWRFDVKEGVWGDGSNPELDPKPFPKPAGRGAALATDGDDIIYALRGNDTKEIWRYVISEDLLGNDPWAPGPKIPLDMREGGTLVYLGGDVYATQGRQQKDFLKISPLPPFELPLVSP